MYIYIPSIIDFSVYFRANPKTMASFPFQITPLLCFLLLLLSSPTFSFQKTISKENFLKSSKNRAEKLIRQLNLFPKHDINIVSEEYSTAISPGIVETSFVFPSIANSSGPSVQDLGHHAGYFRLPHTEGARYIFITLYTLTIFMHFLEFLGFRSISQ